MLYPTRGAVWRPWASKQHPRGMQGVRIFYHVRIVYISPPGVELRVLSLYFAYFVHAFVLFIDDTYCVHSTFSALHVRKHMLAASVAIGDRRK